MFLVFFYLQASYFRGKCICECAKHCSMPISGITTKKELKEVIAKWRTCPVGGLAPVSPI